MLTMEYIKENDKTYQVQIEELTNRVEYEQRRNQRKDKEIERLNDELKSDENYYVRNLKTIIKEKEQEIERLNNIINELDKQNGELGADLSITEDKLNKANWWLEEMLKQEKDNHTKAIINGALELLLKDSDK